MLFNSTQFMFFFPFVLLVYYLLPVKLRYIWLLISSVYFYMAWNPKYIVLLGVSILTTWLGGLAIESAGNKKQKKLFLLLTVCVNLAMLIWFKYIGFFIDIANDFLGLFSMDRRISAPVVVLPVGISFFTFQALGYLIDVYRGDIKAEKSFFRYALFVSFFPQLVAGPIERSRNLLGQVALCTKQSLLDWKKIYRGALYMLWGFFLKIVIADRLAVIVEQVFDQYYLYGTLALAAGSVCFAVQIYCDFAGYSIIAIGAARMMGFSLMENFDTPYLAESMKDFWRRWHLSLSTWFRDYVYIPLGGNRKGTVRKDLNLLLTMLLSGLWHGAGFHFVVWGCLHGLFQIAEDLIDKTGRRYGRHRNYSSSFSARAGRMLCTFVLCDIAWIFFRADNIHIAADYIRRLFTMWDPWVLSDGTLLSMAGGAGELLVLLAAFFLLLAVDLIRYRRKMIISDWVASQGIVFQGLWILGLLFFIIIFGAYGDSFNPQAFIYFQF